MKQGLKNPTQYHIQQTQLRLAKERGDAPTPQNSYVNPLADTTLLSLSQYQFQQQLAQQYSQHTSPTRTVVNKHATAHPLMRPQDSGSPTLEEQMDYTDSYGNTMISPASNPPSDEFEPPTFDYSSARHVQGKSIAHPPTNDGGYGESPSNNSIQSFNQDGDFLLDDPSAFSPGSGSSIGPIDMKGGSVNRFGDFQQGQGFHPTSFGKMPLSAPPMFGTAGDISISQNGFSMPSSTPMRFQQGSELAGGMGSIPEAGSFEEHDYTHQINLQHVMEKRRRRRESHNAVERRRRDNINEKIQELGALLPEQLNDGAQKPNKGAILRKSVEHIKHLQREASDYKKRMTELENVVAKLSAMGISLPDGIVPSVGSNTQANGQTRPAQGQVQAQNNINGVSQGMQGIPIGGSGSPA